jgi:penicillin-binding protein 1A
MAPHRGNTESGARPYALSEAERECPSEMRYVNDSGRPRRAPSKPRKPRSRVRTAVVRIILVLFFFGLGGAAGLTAVLYYLSADLPAIGPLLEGYDPPQITRILAADGTVIGELFVERRTVVPMIDIPKVMVDAVIAAEDADFRRHEGLDYPGMVRALFANVAHGKLSQGGSTITQQVARTFFLTRKKTLIRKLREILLTKRIEERLTKDEILYLYLNQINFGHGRYGVGEAARFYFSKDIRDITVAEAALLAGIPKGPSIYEPFSHPDNALARRGYVLAEMAKNGLISGAHAELACAEPLGLKGEQKRDDRLAPEVVEQALRELEGALDRETLRHGGYVIETSVDPVLQRAAREAVARGLDAVDARNGRLAPFGVRGNARRSLKTEPCSARTLRVGTVCLGRVTGADDVKQILRIDLGGRAGVVELARLGRYNPEGLAATQFAERGALLRVAPLELPEDGSPARLRLEVGPQAALVAVEPGTGKVIALVGGDDVEPAGFDRASSAVRQPGSAFKPLVYLEALRTRRYTAATLVDDSPEVDGEWQPKNSHTDVYAGAVPMRDAIARSLNLPAVKVIRDVGPEAVAELAARLGISSRLDPGPALALGSSAVTPVELATAYAALAAGGVVHKPWVVRRATGPDGAQVPLLGRFGERVLAEEEAYIMTSLLTSVIEYGTGAEALALRRPAAGKTGTTNEARDAWFAGYTPDVAAVVWVGYDDVRPLGPKEYGGRAALPIWLAFMKRAHAGLPVREFTAPPGVVTALVDPATGLLAYEGEGGAREEVFIEGTAPTETALPPGVLSLDAFMLEQAARGCGADATDAGPGSGGDGGANPGIR